MLARTSIAVVLVLWPVILHAANILVFMPFPLKSHFGGFQPMFKELAHRGHNVTVVSSFPLANDRRIPNYTDIDVSPSEVFNLNVMNLINFNYVTWVINRWSFSSYMSNLMENEKIQELIRSESNYFDLIIIEAFYQEYTVTLGHKFNAPVINVASASIWPSVSKWIHVPSTFSYIPNCCIGLSDHMSFIERLKNTIAGSLEMYVENYLYMPTMKSVMNKYFAYKGWESRPPLEEMLSNVSLTLMNAHRTIGVCRPYLPGVIEVGGMHIKNPKPLPQDLQDYIDSASDGVIFFSFGSIVNLSHLPEEILNMLFNVLGRLKQKVILKWTPEGVVKLPPNVKIGSWFPQNDILAHSNVKLFITHGGFHSIEEAVYNTIPIVGIPFFADQMSNLRIVEENGYGKMIMFNDLTDKSFGNVIEEVLSNTMYKDNVIIQNNLYRDLPMKPINQAIYWIEYVIRNDGAKHLKSDSVGLNNAQYFVFDVIIFLLFLTGIFTYMFYRAMTKVALTFKSY